MNAMQKPLPYIDPDMARILAGLKDLPKTDLRAMPISAARQTFIQQQTPWAWCPHELSRVEERVLPARGGDMRARLYIPHASGPLPVVIFAHGGGWTFGNIDTHDGTMRWLAAMSDCAILGIDYRLAPEHPFPAGMNDICDSIDYVASGACGSTCDGGRIALAGDSAGANIALGTLLNRRDEGLPLPATACLFYGCYAPLFDTRSHAANGNGDFMLTTDMMRWYWNHYLGGLNGDHAPGACTPLHAALSGLPPLYLNAAALDPLLDDSMILCERLARAGVQYTFDLWPGVVHGFLRLARELPAAQKALAAAGAHLKKTFNQKNQT